VPHQLKDYVGTTRARVPQFWERATETRVPPDQAGRGDASRFRNRSMHNQADQK